MILSFFWSTIYSPFSLGRLCWKWEAGDWRRVRMCTKSNGWTKRVSIFPMTLLILEGRYCEQRYLFDIRKVFFSFLIFFFFLFILFLLAVCDSVRLWSSIAKSLQIVSGKCVPICVQHHAYVFNGFFSQQFLLLWHFVYLDIDLIRHSFGI